MKKTLLLMVVALGLVGAAGCSDKHSGARPMSEPDAIFTGVLPAADADGVRYTLKLDYDDDRGNMAGDYDLVETYLVADSIQKSGARDANSFRSEGDFTVDEGSGTNAGKKFIKLVSDRRDSSAGSAEGPLYFLVESDTTLVLVDQNLTPSSNPGLNYTLRKVK